MTEYPVEKSAKHISNLVMINHFKYFNNVQFNARNFIMLKFRTGVWFFMWWSWYKLPALLTHLTASELESLTTLIMNVIGRGRSERNNLNYLLITISTFHCQEAGRHQTVHELSLWHCNRKCLEMLQILLQFYNKPMHFKVPFKEYFLSTRC